MIGIVILTLLLFVLGLAIKVITSKPVRKLLVIIGFIVLISYLIWGNEWNIQLMKIVNNIRVGMNS